MRFRLGGSLTQARTAAQIAKPSPHCGLGRFPFGVRVVRWRVATVVATHELLMEEGLPVLQV